MGQYNTPADLVEQIKDLASKVATIAKIVAALPRIKVGTVTLTWPGGSQSTNAPTVAHNLGRTPIGVWAAPVVTPVDAYSWTGSLGLSTFVVVAKTSTTAPSAGATATIAWLAIG